MQHVYNCYYLVQWSRSLVSFSALPLSLTWTISTNTNWIYLLWVWDCLCIRLYLVNCLYRHICSSRRCRISGIANSFTFSTLYILQLLWFMFLGSFCSVPNCLFSLYCHPLLGLSLRLCSGLFISLSRISGSLSTWLSSMLSLALGCLLNTILITNPGTTNWLLSGLFVSLSISLYFLSARSLILLLLFIMFGGISTKMEYNVNVVKIKN